MNNLKLFITKYLKNFTIPKDPESSSEGQKNPLSFRVKGEIGILKYYKKLITKYLKNSLKDFSLCSKGKKNK